MTHDLPRAAKPRASLVHGGGVLLLVVVVATNGSMASLWHAPFEPFVAQEPLQGSWLAVRVGLLAAALLVASAAARPRDRAALAAGAIAFTTATLVLRGLLLPWIGIVAFAVSVANLPLPAWARARARPVWALAYAIVLVAVAVVAHRPMRAVDPPPADAPTAVRYWQGRENPFRARHAARIWAAAEADRPATGHLTLAELDLQLGRPDRANQVLRKTLAQAPDEAIRREAERRLAQLPRLSP